MAPSHLPHSKAATHLSRCQRYVLLAATTTLGMSSIARADLDPDDARPIIEPQGFSLTSERAAGTEIGIVLATDSDGPQPLSFALTDGNSDHLFSIGPSSGQLSLNKTLSSGTLKRQLVVNVSDGLLSSAATITVTADSSGQGKVYVSSTGGLQVFDLDLGMPAGRKEIRGVSGHSTHVALNARTHRGYAANYEAHLISVIDTDVDQMVKTVPINMAPWYVAVSKDGNHVFASDPAGTVTTLDPVSWNSVSVTVAGSPSMLVTNPMNHRVYVANDSVEGGVFVLEETDLSLLRRIETGSHTMDLALSENDGRVYALNNGSDTLSVIDTTTDTLVATAPVSQNATRIALSPDGALLYVGGLSTVSVIDTDGMTPAGMVWNLPGAPRMMASTVDATHIAIVHQDSTQLSLTNTQTLHVDNYLSLGGAAYSVATMPTAAVIEESSISEAVWSNGFEVTH